MHFHVESLGGLRLRAAGREITDLRQHRVRAALLIYIAVERRVSRDTVMATFWPESDTENARHALRQALYRLKQTLGDDGWITVQGDELIAAPR